jgi:3-hydroxyacyl-CoA dehydrogenase
MNIGILGSGLMGGKLGTLFARAGHDVVFSDTKATEARRSRTASSASWDRRPG